jgi:hypothetical protein
VEITTLTDIDRFDSDVVHIPEFVVTRPIDEVPPPPNGDKPEGRYAWAKEMGGVDATGSLFRRRSTSRCASLPPTPRSSTSRRSPSAAT